MNMNGFKQMLKQHIEVLFFFIVIGLNLIPVFSGKFFPSMDGAAHLNNSQLIKELLLGSNTFLKDFFVFNPEPVPNWIGHFILVFFKMFLPSYLAEKSLLLIYFIGLPLAFRGLIKTISPNNVIYSYFIFPFTYSSVFLLGFYNFSLAIILFFITLNYWIIVANKKTTIKSAIILFLLISATYFSHIFMFALLLFSIGLHIVTTLFIALIENVERPKTLFLSFVKKTITIIVCSIIPLILFGYYVVSRGALQVKNYIPKEELIGWIKNIRPIIAYNPPIEEAFTTKIFYVLTALFILALYHKIDSILNAVSRIKPFRENLKSIFKVSDFWLLCFILVLGLYFVMPDSDDSGGFFSVRLGLLFFMILILWLSTQQVSKWFNITAIAIVLVMHFNLNNTYANSIKELDMQAQECYNAAEVIPENSVVLPLDFSNHWLQGHFSNYLGADKSLIILENYECDKGYFPLLWNKEKYPNFLLDGKTPDEIECLWWKTDLNNGKKQIDYVFILGDINTIFDACIQTNILYKFEKVYQGSGCTVFKVK